MAMDLYAYDFLKLNLKLFFYPLLSRFLTPRGNVLLVSLEIISILFIKCLKINQFYFKKPTDFLFLMLNVLCCVFGPC